MYMSNDIIVLYIDVFGEVIKNRLFIILGIIEFKNVVNLILFIVFNEF